MLRFNKFTQFIADGSYTILFNLQTESFIVLSPRLAGIVDDHKKSVDSLEQMHPELFAEMRQKGFLVPDDADEVSLMVESWKKADRNPVHFGMIVNPTLACNLRCWYCYEEHDRKPFMPASVLQSVCRLIEKKTSAPGLKSLSISFFGGEPLMGFREIIVPLLTYAAKACGERNISLTSSMTTNGVLLTDEVLSFLENTGLSRAAHFQISLDGNRDYHNRIRVGADRQPTYDRILANIILAARRGHAVTVRLNYTAASAATFMDVMDEFKELPADTRKYIRFNFQQIWKDKANDIHERIDSMKEIFRKEHFTVESDHIAHRHRCYADWENNVVINSDGNLFKCTARDFTPAFREGQLTEDGEIVWNDRFRQRMEAKYSNRACLACKILPLCNGGCSQGKIESRDKDICYKNMSEDAKDEIIIRRLKELIAMQQKSSACPEEGCCSR